MIKKYIRKKTSLKEANGNAVGITGIMHCFNADTKARFSEAMMNVGKQIESESGSFLGHIKAAVFVDGGTGMTFNLTNIENGVELHGSLDPQDNVRFNFMCAVLDVDKDEIKHMMFHAIDDSGIDYELDENVECNCHKHHLHSKCDNNKYEQHDKCDRLE